MFLNKNHDFKIRFHQQDLLKLSLKSLTLIIVLDLRQHNDFYSHNQCFYC